MKLSQPDPLLLHTDAGEAARTLADQGFALLAPEVLAGWVAERGVADPEAALDEFATHWQNLPADAYLRDGGRYRYRRHASLIQRAAQGDAELQPHRAHWQPTTYNALHGGIERWFEPVEAGMLASPAWQALIAPLGQLFGEAESLRGLPRPDWFIEAHTFRIDTRNGVGRPTPEGAHRDGVNYVAVVLVRREGIIGGESRVFDADGPHGLRFTLESPFSVLLLDDRRVIHETTPIQPGEQPGARDTFVITYRTGGFQDPLPDDERQA